MSYTCGALTTDDINMALDTFGASNTSSFICGWWKPTTLTAGRGLWSAGTIFGAEIDTVTSEIRLKTDNATTDGEWTTTGAGLTVNQWQFLAFANSCINGSPPNCSWVVWSGTNQEAPVQVTITPVVLPLGNFTGSTSHVLGNKGNTGSLAFQGELGTAVHGRHTASIRGYVPTTTAGTINQEGIDYVYQSFVLPIWAGDWNPFRFRHPRLTGGTQSGMITPLDYGGPIEYTINTSTGQGFGAVTINGCTLSGERPPRAMPRGSILQPLYRLRR